MEDKFEFIRFTSNQNKEVYININNVSSVQEHEGNALVTMNNGDKFISNLNFKTFVKMLSSISYDEVN